MPPTDRRQLFRRAVPAAARHRPCSAAGPARSPAGCRRRRCRRPEAARPTAGFARRPRPPECRRQRPRPTTPAGALPCRVCSSSEPSPVMTSIGAGQLLVEVDEIEHQLDPRAQRRAEQRDGGEPDPAGGAGTGGIAHDRHRWRQRRHRPSGRQRRVQLRDIVGVGALLRPVHRGGAAWVRSAGCPRRRRPRSRRRPARGASRPGRAGRCRPSARHRRRSPCRRRRTACAPRALTMPGAAVGAGAAADADHDPPATGVEGRGDQLAGTPRTGRQRCQPPTGQLREPRHVGQFDHGDVTEPGVAGVDRLAGRAGRSHRNPLSSRPRTRRPGCRHRRRRPVPPRRRDPAPPAAVRCRRQRRPPRRSASP